MKRQFVTLAAAAAVLASSVAASTLRASEPASKPASQTSLAQLAGAWTLVSVENIQPDGTRTEPYGLNPNGLLMIDAQGRYSLQAFRAGRQKFAANDKSRGTPAEYEATVNGTNSHFGRLTIEVADHRITFQIEHASFPNWEGTEQKRTFTLKGDELSYTVPVTTSGPGTVAEVRWRRIDRIEP